MLLFSDDIEATSDDDLDIPGPEGKKLPLPMKKLEAFYTMRMMKSAQHKLQVCLVLFIGLTRALPAPLSESSRRTRLHRFAPTSDCDPGPYGYGATPPAGPASHQRSCGHPPAAATG